MTCVATITPDLVPVQPGGEVTCEIRVRNTGTIVDQFSFEALGEGAPWVTFEPSTVSLFPDGEEVTRLVVRPPRAAQTPTGPCPVGIRVRSREHPRDTVVEELDLDIGLLSDTYAELIPRTSRASRRGVHHLAVDNRGNGRLNATLTADDPEDRLSFAFDPPAVVAEPGTAAFAKIKVRPLKRFLRGQAVSHPFHVRIEPEGDAAVVVEGTLLQEPLLPKWVARAVVGLLVGGVAGMVLWATMLRPTVRSAAKEAAEDAVGAPLKEASAQMAALTKQLGTQPPAVTPVTATDSKTDDATGDANGANGAAAAGQLGTPFDGRLQTGPGAQTVSYPVPAGKVFSLTDIFLQNPQGDRGLLTVKRGDATLLSVRLENFRDLDYHFVSPMVFTAGQQLILAVQCENQAGGAGCTPAAYYGGFLREV